MSKDLYTAERCFTVWRTNNATINKKFNRLDVGRIVRGKKQNRFGDRVLAL